MAKKTKAELVEEAKDLNAVLADGRKASLNFALLLGKDGFVLETHKTKATNALRSAAKGAGGGPKGGVGTLTVAGKDMAFSFEEEGANVPKTFPKQFKKHLSDRGITGKVIMIIGKETLDADTDIPAEDPSLASDPVPADDPADNLKLKLEKAYKKASPDLKSALTSAPDVHKKRLRDANTAYEAAMKAEEYETAMQELVKLRKEIAATPSPANLTEKLKANAAAPEKLAGMAPLLNNILKDTKPADGGIAKNLQPQLRVMRKSLKAALAKPLDGEDKKRLQAMKDAIDKAFVDEMSYRKGKGTGHGPDRHEGGVTKEQLIARAIHHKDPMTGTDRDGTKGGGPAKKDAHYCNKFSTRITNEAAYVDADLAFRDHPNFDSNWKAAQKLGRDQFKIELSIEDALGAGFASSVEGVERIGKVGDDKVPTKGVDFSGGTVVAFYKKMPGGSFEVVTLYPNPVIPPKAPLK